jgi:hypothetical protein
MRIVAENSLIGLLSSLVATAALDLAVGHLDFHSRSPNQQNNKPINTTLLENNMIPTLK